MKYLTGIILGILSVSLFVLCSYPKENRKVKIDFDQLNKKDNLFSDEVFAKVAYVPLESDSACFIGSNAEFRLIGSKFYFLDPVEQQVFVFEEDGKFVNKIGRAGRGPGEYISATDFWVDTERGVVEILSYYNKKIYSYSLDGRFIGDRNGINAYSFIKGSNGNYWLCKGVTADEQIGNEQIYEVDQQNKVIRKYLPLAHTLHAGIPETSFSVGGDQSVLYFSHFDNQVYRILPDTIRTFFEFDFGSLAYPRDLFGRPMAEVMHVMTKEDHLSVDKCLENSEYVYFFIIQTGEHYKYYHLLYHKDSGKILCKGLERTSWEYELLRGAKALTETNELIFLVNPESYNEALNRKSTLFYQKGEKIQDTDGTNNLLLKMKFRNSPGL